MTTPQRTPNAVDIAQASELTGLSKKAVRRRVERGTLASLKVGDKRMIPISELENHGLLRTAVDLPDSAPDRAPDGNLGAAAAAAPSASQPTDAQELPPVADTPMVAAPPPSEPSPPPSMGAPAPPTSGYPPGQFVPVQAGHPYGTGPYPPERGGWYYWYRYPTLRWLAVLLLLALIALLVWFLAFRSSGSETGDIRAGGGPVGVTQEQLIALSQQLHQPIYWAGTMPGTRLELTETDNSYAYLRYLTQDSPVGDPAPDFLTVGTYPSLNAYRNLSAYASHSRARTKKIQHGGLAVVIPGSPTSVYFAYPHEDVQVEVYDPEPQRALELVKSGVVRPVTGTTGAVATAPSAGSVTVPASPTTTTTPSELPTIP